MTRKEFENKATKIRPELLAYAIYLLKDSAEAEDIVQDVLLRLWFLKESLQKYSSFKSIALLATRQLIFNNLRNKKIHKTLADVNLLSEIPQIDSEEISEEILNALKTLPNKEQAVLRLKHIEGFETEEIASIIGSKPGAVRTALSRARKKMRDILLSDL